MNRRKSFRSDQKGAVAFEVPFVFGFLFLAILLPLVDLGIFGFEYISAYSALRNVGEYIQYHPPADLTSPGTWVSSLPSSLTSVDGYTISSIQVLCSGGATPATCSSGNTAVPAFYSFTTSFTLNPMVLRRVLCSNPACSFTLNFTERFQ